MASIGMMDSAYFVGRLELLKWLNEFLDLSYTKIEQVCTGAAFCQLMDALQPGCIAIHRIKWDAKLEYEFVHNFKLLQTCFDKLKIKKHIEVQRLIKGKFQDNLEFCQWMKRFFEGRWDGTAYNAADRRRIAKAISRKKIAASRQTALSKRTRTATTSSPVTNSTTTTTTSSSRPRSASCAASPTKKTPSPTTKRTKPATRAVKAASNKPNATSKQSQDLARMVMKVKHLEQEKEFYISKLQEIDAICKEAEQAQEHQDSPLIEKLFNIMYIDGNSATPKLYEGAKENC